MAELLLQTRRLTRAVTQRLRLLRWLLFDWFRQNFGCGKCRRVSSTRLDGLNAIIVIAIQPTVNLYCFR